jgi:iron complex transport system permease protein
VVLKVLLNAVRVTRFSPSWEPHAETILMTLRLPVVLGAALVGAALATAGTLFQGLLRNPLSDPYVLGTSGGAALGAVAGMLVGARVALLGFAAVPLGAFLGALGAMVLVVRLASVGGRLPIVTVLLAGFAVSTLLSYAMSLLLFLNDQGEVQLPRVYAWMLGGISLTGWSQLAVVAPLILGSLVGALPLAPVLNALSLGEEGAARLGVRVETAKRWIIATGAVLTGLAVSISGLVGFVGLVVPHVVRLLVGPDHRLLLPATALAGAVFLVLADLVSRTVLPPSGLPLGIVTALAGGPFFLYLLRRSRREYQW